MKKKFQFPGVLLSLFLVVTMFTWHGCTDDLLDTQNADLITPDQHYNSIEDLQNAIGGAVITLQDKLPHLILLDGLRSDIMDVTYNADPLLVSINHHDFATGNAFTDPADLYKVIININDVLENLNKIEDPDFDEIVFKPQIVGALIGMRGWVYLNLARLYGEVTYIEGSLTSLADGVDLPVLSSDAIIDTIINQVTPYIHNSETTSYVEIRVDYYINNKALLGELYLEKNDYANAALYLKLACESYLNQPRVYKVDNTYKDNAWSTIFLNSDSQFPENIGVIPYSSRNQQNNPLANWMGFDLDYMVKPSQMLVDSFMSQQRTIGNDPGDLWRGFGVTFNGTLVAVNDTTMVLTEPYITKYAVDQNDPKSSDIIYSRATDLHLLLAEAYNRMGDPDSEELALLLLNAGINSINPKPTGFTRWSTNLGVRGRVSLKAREVPEELTGLERIEFIEDLILAERAMELAFEGKRWNDLVRVANRRGDPAYLADKVAAKFEGTAHFNTVRNKLLDQNNWYLPY